MHFTNFQQYSAIIHTKVGKVIVLVHLSLDKYSLKISNSAVKHATLKVPYECPIYEQTICIIQSFVLIVLGFFHNNSLET
jgi:hypothetical protein